MSNQNAYNYKAYAGVNSAHSNANYLNNYSSGYNYSVPAQQPAKVAQANVHAAPASYATHQKFNNSSYPVYSSPSQAKYPVYSNQNTYATQKAAPRQPLRQQRTANQYSHFAQAQAKPAVYYQQPQQHQQQQHQFQHQQHQVQHKPQQQQKNSLLAASGLINASGSAFYDF